MNWLYSYNSNLIYTHAAWRMHLRATIKGEKYLIRQKFIRKKKNDEERLYSSDIDYQNVISGVENEVETGEKAVEGIVY